MKLVDSNFLFLSSSISVVKGKLIPSEKKKEKEKEKVPMSQNDQND